MNIYKGISASAGIGISSVYFANTAALIVPKNTILDSEKDSQWEKFENARNQVLETMTKASENTSPEQAAIFQTYCMMLSDPDFISQVKNDFQAKSFNIEHIINEKVNEFAQNLILSGDDYLKARAEDIKDVYNKVLSQMLDQKVLTAKNIPEGSVLVAGYINPSDAMFITQKKLKGIVTTEGGKHSHLAILANTYGIPFVYGIENIDKIIKTNDTVIVDGNSGTIYVNPDEVVLHVFNAQIKDLEEENSHLAKFKGKNATTKDGVKININANIGNVEEGFLAFEDGADGIGLFRSEFLFMEKADMSEESQFAAYKQVLEIAKEKTVTIRTLDCGGDKIIKSPDIIQESEKNPLLGWRAIRFTLDNTDLFKTQLRALYRASVFGNLKIMFPLISCHEQVMSVLKLVKEVQNQLTQEKIPFDKNVPLGIMIETPAAALIADHLAPTVSFFSIGTNDLTQYTTCVDRENAKVSHLFSEFHPAVIRLIKNTIEAGQNHNIDVSVCGELAGSIEGAILLVGMGVRTLSVSSRKINKVKEVLSRFSLQEIENIALETLKHPDAETVLSTIQAFIK